MTNISEVFLRMHKWDTERASFLRAKLGTKQRGSQKYLYPNKTTIQYNPSVSDWGATQMSTLLSVHGVPYWRSSKNDTEREWRAAFSFSQRLLSLPPSPCKIRSLCTIKETRSFMLLLTLECLNSFKKKKINFFLLNTCSSQRIKNTQR